MELAGSPTCAPTSSLPQVNYHQDTLYSKPEGASDDSAESYDSVRRVVRQVVPHAHGVPDSDMEVSVVAGGITNRRFKVGFASSSNEGQERPSVLLRVFGAKGMIDRDLENATYVALAEANIGPGYYGRFGNGRVESFIEDVTALTLDDMADADTSTRIAEQVARLHQYKLPEELQGYYSTPSLWPQIFSWLSQAKNDISAGKLAKHGAETEAKFTRIASDLVGESFQAAEEELAILKNKIPVDASTAFCNNDLLCGNILKSKSSGAIQLIDFEYGGCNFRAFEIANHWNEYAGGTDEEMNGRCEYERFPSDDQQRAFCRAYLQASGASSSHEDVTALVQEAQLFVQVDHWYWGLWAINQAIAEGTQDFNYLNYCESRLRRYYETKK